MISQIVNGEVQVETKLPNVVNPRVTVKLRLGSKSKAEDLTVHPQCTFGSSVRSGDLIQQIGGHDFCVPTFIPP